MKESMLCVLCGERPATTRDHIPPKGIYPEPRDNDMQLFTVPACSECNNSASQYDEEFKTFITIDTSSTRKVQEQQLVNHIAGTVGHNPRIANHIFKSARRCYANLGSDILQPAVHMQFDFISYERVIDRIVRGLYWREKKQILSRDIVITARPFRDMKIAQDVKNALEEIMGCCPIRFLNKDTFAYKYIFFEADHAFWAMNFFQSHSTFAYVHPKGN
jgi:hypothetical protein